ncbi:MAG: hypothetical protein JXB30_18490, partial [Anaerolineae bacterium]|nr:hypothetical protein [Anaerolineae bacterium]
MSNKTAGFMMVVAMVLFGVVLSGCAVPGAAAKEPAQSPEAVVESFYTWAIGYGQFDPDTQEHHNPMVDGSYRSRQELGPEMIERYDAIVASFDERGGGYDPFLCAQDVPNTITVNQAEYDGNAYVQVDTSFEGHSILVELTLIE